MGDAPTLWTPEFLAACPEADELVDVHVCPPTHAGSSDASPPNDVSLAATVDLAGHRAPGTRRNFEFRKMPFGELVRRISSEGPGEASAEEGAFAPVIAPGEKYYLRSVAKRPTKTAAHLPAEFPSLAATLAKGGAILPGGPRALFDERSYHSTVLRVASEGTALWTHYDTHDNLLAQVVGRKTVTLWPPEAAPFLYVQGSSSRVDYALEDRGGDGGSAGEAGSGFTFDAVRFPAFRSALASRRVVELGPGEALFVPALWFHHVAADAREGSGPSIAVNAFWRPARVPETESDPGDVFGNKDPPASRRAAELAARAGSALANLPEPHRTFYARRAIEAFAAQLGRRVEAESDGEVGGSEV
jgi:tRNA wybutosine-synthesizing protein 5